MTSLHITAGPDLTNRRSRTIDISPGATVRVSRWDGRTITAKVEAGIDEKDGRTVIDLSDGSWAYTDQVISGQPAKKGSQEVSHYQDNGWDDEGWDDDDDWD